MIDTKISKTTILIALLALVGALAIAGCGGSGGTTSSEQGATGGEEPNATKEAEEAPAEETAEEPAEEAEEEPAEEAPAEKEPAEEEAGEETGGAAAASAEGKTIFTTNCGSCHTLQAAGTTGTVGPDLDELEPSLETVEHQVQNGGGPMPAFGNEGTLSAEEVKAVSTYVSSVAGKG